MSTPTYGIEQVRATARGVIPRPADMPQGARLVKVTWREAARQCHYDGPGFWWVATGPSLESIQTAASFAAGTEVTLEWTKP